MGLLQVTDEPGRVGMGYSTFLEEEENPYCIHFIKYRKKISHRVGHEKIHSNIEKVNNYFVQCIGNT